MPDSLFLRFLSSFNATMTIVPRQGWQSTFLHREWPTKPQHTTTMSLQLSPHHQQSTHDGRYIARDDRRQIYLSYSSTVHKFPCLSAFHVPSRPTLRSRCCIQAPKQFHALCTRSGYIHGMPTCFCAKAPELSSLLHSIIDCRQFPMRTAYPAIHPAKVDYDTLCHAI